MLIIELKMMISGTIISVQFADIWRCIPLEHFQGSRCRPAFSVRDSLNSFFIKDMPIKRSYHVAEVVCLSVSDMRLVNTAA